MTEFSAELVSARKRDVFGIAGIAIATLLILAAAEWPYGYYQFLRIITCVFSTALAYRAFQSDSKGWLIFAVVGATLFNPVFPIEMADWSLADLVFAVGYGAYGIGLLSRPIGKIVAVVIWVVVVGLFGTTYYVNHYMPHGPSYPTGDIVCMNDGRGPCGEEQKEDMRGLDIPAWAKFLREDYLLLMLALVGAGALSSRVAWGEEEEDEWEEVA